MQTEPDQEEYHKNWVAAYEGLNYDRSMAGRVLSSTHALIEKPFGNDSYFDQVLEVGAGHGAHFKHVQHRFKQYVMSDGSADMVELLSKQFSDRSDIVLAREDASQLSFTDNQFDRLIATHVLEHLPEPYKVLREWNRVVKPGGVISIILPCDPGLLWRLGRHFGPRRKATAAGIAYDYWMAREHINSIGNLVAFLRYYFPDAKETWWPSRIPIADTNLIYAININI